jgi:hypothetical protein
MLTNNHSQTPIQFDEIDPLVLFIEEHASGLRYAAGLLGRQSGMRLVDEIVENLASTAERSSTIDRRIDRLEALLGLDNVHIEGSLEAVAFATLHPGDPRVEEICLLLDQLRDVRRQPVPKHADLVRLRSAQPTSASEFGEASNPTENGEAA